MTPVFFGTSDARLYGVYEPSVRGGDHGAVLCAPWGQEYLRAHPSMRHLARLLTRAGVHTFRFDYTGTGDSDGSDTDGSLERWIDDTLAAIDELTETAGLRKVSLIGLRLGAAVAAQAAERHGGVHRLVLWDPVVDGAAWMHAAVPAGQRAFPVQVGGFPLTAEFAEEIASVNGAIPEQRLPPVLLVSTAATGDLEALEQRLHDAGTDVTRVTCPGAPAWEEIGNFGAAGMPVTALQRIAEWVAA
jgi:pimeloyl-ACP methyl ester carboxylesterase